MLDLRQVSELMTVTEAAKLIGVTGRRIRQFLQAGELTGVRLTPRMWLVDKKSVERLARKKPSKVGRPRKISGQL